MKTLYLHIGTPKTATTAIQRFCTTNEEVLAGKGYYYPKATRQYPGVSIRRNGHFLVGKVADSNGERDKNMEEEIFLKGLEKLRKLFLTYDNIVLSDEGIWRATSYGKGGIWKRLLEESRKVGYQIKIIVYLRRQDVFYASRWNQIVKGSNFKESWEEHIRDTEVNQPRILNYYKKIRAIANVFGKENIIVRRFDRSHFKDGSIYHDFLDCLGLPWSEEYEIKEEEPNQSLKGNTHEMRLLLNNVPSLDLEEQKYLGKVLLECSENADPEFQYSMLSREETEKFLERYREGNRKLAEEFIGDGEDLFDYTIKDLPKWEKNNDYQYDDMVRFVGVSNAHLWSEYKELQEEFRSFRYKVKHPFKALACRILHKKLPV